MKIGIMCGTGFVPGDTLQALIENAQRFESMGFDNLWLANIYGYDALSALVAVGGQTSRMELGTAVVTAHVRHPFFLAQQVATAAAACDNRFTLGLGLSHKYVVEEQMGLSYDKPVRYMREYTDVLLPLLRGEAVTTDGEEFRVNAQLTVPELEHIPVLLAALGPGMLKLAGARTQGTTLWLTGPKTIANHTVPLIRQAAQEHGRPLPRVVAGCPICLTNNEAAARAMINEALELYGTIPSYRAMLDREGAAGPGDVALVGDEASLRQQLSQLAALGVTDLNAVLVNDGPEMYERTLQFLAGELGSH